MCATTLPAAIVWAVEDKATHHINALYATEKLAKQAIVDASIIVGESQLQLAVVSHAVYGAVSVEAVGS
jgi:hypothetical protein